MENLSQIRQRKENANYRYLILLTSNLSYHFLHITQHPMGRFCPIVKIIIEANKQKEKNMKINVKNEELYEFSECVALFTRENGFVGLDIADVKWAFPDTSEIEFHVITADSLENVYEKLKKRLPELKYDSAFIIFSVKQGLLASIDLAKIDAAQNRFIEDYLNEDGKIIWGLYEPRQEENYRIYLFCPNNTP